MLVDAQVGIEQRNVEEDSADFKLNKFESFVIKMAN